MAPTPSRALGGKSTGRRKALSVSVSYAKLAERLAESGNSQDDDWHLPNAHKDSFAIRDMLVGRCRWYAALASSLMKSGFKNYMAMHPMTSKL